MYNFDYKPDRVSEKCRKWDINIIKDRFMEAVKRGVWVYLPL